MLEYRRVLVDWQPVEIAKPGQCLIDTGVASSRLAWPRALGRRLLRRHVVLYRLLWRGVPWRRDAVTMALHQAALLSSARIPACAGSPRNATARSRQGGSPGAPAARLIRH